MVLVLCLGLTVPNILGIGLSTELAGKASLYMQRVMSMMESGTWTGLSVMEFISTSMVHFTKDSGKKISSMGTGMKNG